MSSGSTEARISAWTCCFGERKREREEEEQEKKEVEVFFRFFWLGFQREKKKKKERTFRSATKRSSRAPFASRMSTATLPMSPRMSGSCGWFRWKGKEKGKWVVKKEHQQPRGEKKNTTTPTRRAKRRQRLLTAPPSLSPLGKSLARAELVFQDLSTSLSDLIAPERSNRGLYRRERCPRRGKRGAGRGGVFPESIRTTAAREKRRS